MKNNYYKESHLLYLRKAMHKCGLCLAAVSAVGYAWVRSGLEKGNDDPKEVYN